MNSPWNPAPRHRRGPVTLIVLGPLLMLVGLILFIVGDVFDPTRGMLAVTAIPGETTVDLPAGRYQVVALGPDLVTTRERGDGRSGRDLERRRFDEPGVSVSGPDGPVSLGADTLELVVDTESTDAVSMAEFGVATPGTYKLRVNNEPTDVVRVGIRERADIGEIVKVAARNTGLIVIGVMVGLIGFAALVGGIICFAVAGRAAGPRPGSPLPPPPTPVAPMR